MALIAGAILCATVQSAAAATPCWKTLLNDWYDGRIDNTYAIHCYTDALKHLPPDVATYSSAHDDIERALQSAIAKLGKTKVNPNTKIAPPPASKTEIKKKMFYAFMHVRYRVLLEKGLREIEQTIALGERIADSSAWIERARV